MPQFKFTAISTQGEQIQGIETAESIDKLTKILKRRKLILVKAKALNQKSVSLAHTTRLIIELNDLISSGVILEQALTILADDIDDPKFSQLCQQLRQQLKSGQSLSQALQQAGKFDPLLIPLIQAGETSGQLAKALQILDNYYQNKKQLRSEIISNLAYPAILVIVCVISLIALALYVIPVFKDIFADNMDTLPLGTLISFQISDWLSAHGSLLLTGIIVFSILFNLALRYSEKFRYYWQVLLFKLPLTSTLISQTQASNIFNVLSVLLESGIPLVKAMQITQSVVTNAPQRQGMNRCIQQLKQGAPLSNALKQIPFLPIIAIRLITVGDQTGKLARSCHRVATIVQRELRNNLKSLVSLLEPAIILFMGGVIGFVIISMLLAVFSMSDLV